MAYTRLDDGYDSPSRSCFAFLELLSVYYVRTR